MFNASTNLHRFCKIPFTGAYRHFKTTSSGHCSIQTANNTEGNVASDFGSQSSGGATIRTVACAISGGVDSAVAALLLKQRGYDVIGVHMVCWDPQEELNGGENGLSEADTDAACPESRDQADAKLLCRRLGIPFHVVDYVRDYWNDVFVKALDGFRCGQTPVPDLVCNRLIKFDRLRDFAFRQLGADALATGHYVRTSQGDFLERVRVSVPTGRTLSKNGDFILDEEKDSWPSVKLLRARDLWKDQSYFLASLRENQLRRVMFPVGSLYKTEVRRIAIEAGLDVAAKDESMGLCFVGKKDSFGHFLDKYLEPASSLGRFVDDETGEPVPEVSHSGVHHFTVGQRLFGYPKTMAQFANQDRLYVTRVEATTQTVYFCRGPANPRLFARQFLITQPHWIAGHMPEDVLSSFAVPGSNRKTRLAFYIQRGHPPTRCIIRPASTLLSAAPEILSTLSPSSNQVCFGQQDTTASNKNCWVLEPLCPVRIHAAGQVSIFYAVDSKNSRCMDECLGYAEIVRPIETLG